MTANLLVIVGNYFGREHRPVVANDSRSHATVVFCDYLHSPMERSRVVAPIARGLGVEVLNVHVIEPTPTGCERGYHAWEPVMQGGAMVAARCECCQTVEAIQPVPVPAVERRQRAS